MHLPIAFILVAGLVAYSIGLSKGGLGGTLGALATPVMALVLPPEQVVGMLLPVLMFADVFAVSWHWKRWDRKQIILLLPGAVAGITIGTFFITNAPAGSLRLTLGIIVILFVIYRLVENRLKQRLYKPRSWHGRCAGTVAGFSSALAHTGGPPVSMYLLMQDLPPKTFVATSALFFAIVNWIKVPYYFYAGLFDWSRLLTILWMLPLVPLGVWHGRKLSERVDKRTFEHIVTALLVAAAVLLIIG
jgi:uncharacterized membrane protein YfcA